MQFSYHKEKAVFLGVIRSLNASFGAGNAGEKHDFLDLKNR